MLNGEPTKLCLHGPLGEQFGAEHNLYISRPGEAIRALCSQFKGFRETLSQPGGYYSLLVGEQAIPLEAVQIQTGNQDIHLVPVVEGYGSGNGGGKILLGAALVAVAAAFTPGGIGAAFVAKGWGVMATAGLSMMIGGVSQLLMAPPKSQTPSERPENNPSELFDGPVNTINQSHPVQICYGEVEIGSAILSTLIDNGDWKRGAGYSGGHSALPIETLREYDERENEIWFQ